MFTHFNRYFDCIFTFENDMGLSLKFWWYRGGGGGIWRHYRIVKCRGNGTWVWVQGRGGRRWRSWLRLVKLLFWTWSFLKKKKMFTFYVIIVMILFCWVWSVAERVFDWFYSLKRALNIYGNKRKKNVFASSSWFFFRYNLRRYDLIYNSNCKYYLIVREKYRYRAKN